MAFCLPASFIDIGAIIQFALEITTQPPEKASGVLSDLAVLIHFDGGLR
jgi:hypothetical protein